MIPSIPFRVEVTFRLGDKHERRVHNFNTLQAANAYVAVMIRKPQVINITTSVVIEELTKHDIRSNHQ